MSIKRPQLVNEEIYHIIIRGVGDSLIFKDKEDYFRAIFSLFEFNTTQPVRISKRRRERRQMLKTGRGLSSPRFERRDRELLVEILAFYFMPNHIHLIVRQIKDNGITRFMRKFGTGYATYFNKKYKRKGHLFQARFKAVHVKTNQQLEALFAYVHTNGISLVEPGWKEKRIRDPEKVIKFLENYKWSSYSDYIGKKNFPSVTKRDFFLKVMGGKEGCRAAIKSWIKYKNGITNQEKLEGLGLE